MNDSTFPTAIAVADARARLVALCAGRRLPAERVTLDAAYGRILAHDVSGDADVPGYANSAMDGYAVRGADLPDQGERTFALAGVRLAGDGRPASVGPGECVRITTGAPLPAGADTVVIKENVRLDGAGVVIAAGETPGANVRPAGEDYRAGEFAFAAGSVLTPARVGVLASFGYADVAVVRAPRAIVLTTGDEVIAPGTPLEHGQIYNSNRASLVGLLRGAGAQVVRHEHLRDDPAALEDALRRAAQDADIVVTSGGVSAGEADHLPSLVARLGRVHFWKVRIKPGMPMLAGEIGDALLFCLPGNPVSGMATFLTLVAPALAAMAGRADDALHWYARTAVPIVKNHRRAEFQRARRESRNDGSVWVTPFPRQGSGVLRSVAEADCLIVLPEETTSLAIGDVVEFLALPGH
jgi:molybdopterin molybdotransferase